MKTTIDIPDEALREAMKYSKATTKRQAVVTALEEYNRRHRQAKLIKHLGTFKDFMTSEELRELRSARNKRHGVD
jgi:Arc/MetJ family transcription regulator